MPAHSSCGNTPLRILVVEDHKDSATVLKMILERKGYDVTVAPSIDRARTIVATQDFDLLISDIMLVDGTGWDLVRELKSTHPMKSIALTMESDIAMSLNAGFDRHICKPFNTDKLVAAIEELAGELRNARYDRL
jgi:DNA-binding response OmpR family regulator